MSEVLPAKCDDLTELDRAIINRLQHGLPICEQPYAEVANELAIDEQALIHRIQTLLEEKTLTRFGPMYDAACLGGAFTLAAIAVSEEDFERVTDIVNSFKEVAHNYKRNHSYNMWFVVATEQKSGIAQVINAIESHTGYPVLNVPKLEEFYVGLYLSA